MKIGLFVSLIILGSSVASADLVQKIRSCYKSNSADRAASFCAENEIAKEIEQLKGVPRPDDPDDNQKKHSTIFTCDQNGDPGLHRLILDKNGITLRDDILQIFTEGDDTQENVACRNQMMSKKFVVRNFNATQCKCSADNDPSLIFEILDEKFVTVTTYRLFTYTVGDDQQERNDCQSDLNQLPFCAFVPNSVGQSPESLNDTH